MLAHHAPDIGPGDPEALLRGHANLDRVDAIDFGGQLVVEETDQRLVHGPIDPLRLVRHGFGQGVVHAGKDCAMLSLDPLEKRGRGLPRRMRRRLGFENSPQPVGVAHEPHVDGSDLQPPLPQRGDQPIGLESRDGLAYRSERQAAEFDEFALSDELTRQQLAEHQAIDDRLVGLQPQRRRAQPYPPQSRPAETGPAAAAKVRTSCIRILDSLRSQ